MHFSNDYGFGKVVARAAVLMAETWTKQQTSYEEKSAAGSFNFSTTQTVPDANATGLTININLANTVEVEQITLDLAIHHTYVGDLVIKLVSPSGTTSALLNRSGDQNDVNDWTFNSNAFRGENSGGTWVLQITDALRGDIGTVTGATLTAHGASASQDNDYFFTDEFGYGLALGNNQTRSHVDRGAGADTVNAASVTYAMTIDLNAGAQSTIAGNAVWLSNMENVIGGEQGDTITGNSADNFLRGGRGNDTLMGNDGNDLLRGDGGGDTMNGGSGNDTFITSSGNDTVIGGSGNDEIVLTSTGRRQTVDLQTDRFTYISLSGKSLGTVIFSSIENLTSGKSGDKLYGDSDSNTLVGEGGGDYLDGRDGADILNGGFKNPDDSRGADGNDTIFGGAGDDLIIASYGTDKIDGGADTDTLSFDWTTDGMTVDLAAGSADLSQGGVYSTRAGFSSWGGSNIHVSWTNIENLTGGAGIDRLSGDAGNNVLDGGRGADTLTGGGGNDTYVVDNRGDRVIEAAGGGRDTVLTAISHTLTAGQEIEILATKNDAGTASINLSGNAFANTIRGNAGKNVINGKAGADVLTGGAGADTFVFDTKLGSGNVDRITDFAPEDTIRLSKLIFSELSAGHLSASEFKDIATTKRDADDHILYDSRNGKLFYDVDGSGKAAAVQFAVLDNKAILDHTDILVV